MTQIYFPMGALPATVIVDNHGTAATPYTLEVSCDKQ